VKSALIGFALAIGVAITRDGYTYTDEVPASLVQNAGLRSRYR